MFETSLHNLLVTDAELASLHSSFSGKPSIFSDFAPQESGEVYTVFDIQKEPGTFLELDTFTINFDIYNATSSNEIIRQIVERLTFILDPNSIDNDLRYRKIRFYRGSEGYIKDNDIEIKHYNLQFFARATRKKWIDQL